MVISVYLWLNNPDKYCVFRYNILKEAAIYLKNDFIPKRGDYTRNIPGNMELVENIRKIIIGDDELVNLFHATRDEKCYADPYLLTLAHDVEVYISKIASEKNKSEIEEVSDVIMHTEPEEVETECVIYSKEKFLEQVYMDSENYELLKEVLLRKKNLILQGPPGVGKTFTAKRLAYSIMGCVDENRVECIQFHQSYSYEDFVMGYKPSGDSFKLEPGVFYEFCKKASGDVGRPYFFIIDEINRGNMSKIFGELLMLIEADYRGKELKLAYDKRPLSVPENIYLIGMMNTADRSLAMIDYALRRRFSFFTMEPGFDSRGFRKHQNVLNNETFDTLIEKIKGLNMDISQDASLGGGFCIGHSYFCCQAVMTDEYMQSVVEYDILPMLEEYWFDEHTKLQKWQNILRGVFVD